MAKVAVITRTRSRPVFLKRALRSVHSQTYKDFEHVIVNDSDEELKTETIYELLSESIHRKVRIINRSKPSDNAPDTILTESVDASQAEYVVIHDDDDTWHEEFLERTVEHLESNPEIGGVLTRADKIIEEVVGEIIRPLKKSHYMPDMKAVSLYRQCIENQLTPIAFVYRRKAYEEAGKYDSSLPVCGDWEFGIRLLTKYDVDYLDPGFALANYHHRKMSKSASGDNSFAKQSHRYYANKIRNTYLRQELNEGRLGVGYIMSKLTYDQSNIANMLKKVLPGGIVNLLKKRVGN